MTENVDTTQGNRTEEIQPYHHFRSIPTSQLNQVLGVVRNVEGRAIETMKVSALLIAALGALLPFFKTYDTAFWIFVSAGIPFFVIGLSIFWGLQCMTHKSVSHLILPPVDAPLYKTDREWAEEFSTTLNKAERNVERCRKTQLSGIITLGLWLLSSCGLIVASFYPIFPNSAS